MSNNHPTRQQQSQSSATSSTSSNHWLSSILRSRASSVSVESCLNLSARDPSQPLDARPVLPLLEQSQPLTSRCKHLAVFSDICKSYRFTHLENVFFTVQDILDASMPREARHGVFEFMLACIEGQYTDLGMARVTFYASLRNYTHWEDFSDMYRVLYKLCKEGRDISGFEKNVAKLLIHWMNIAIQQPHKKEAAVPHLSDLLHLLTAIAKFNFALFEEDEVTQMISATHKAFFSTHDFGDMGSCLDFADIVVRYRFVPFEALSLFLDMVSASIMLVPVELQKSKSWPIFQNLLRSHCAHSAILTLCRFLDKEPSKVDAENILIKGAITLLSEIAWGKSGSGAEVYMVSDSVILMYMRRAASKENDGINGTILQCLAGLVGAVENTPSLMEWDAIWDIVDAITAYILKITDNNSNSDIKLFSMTESASSSLSSTRHFAQFSDIIIRLYQSKQYKGPLTRFMQVLYQLRAYCCDNTASILLDYYVMEHSFLPSTENWLKLLQEVTNTFFIHANPTTTTSALRLTMLDIVSDVCTSVKDFYSEVMYETIVIPMMQKLPLETDANIRQLAIDLLVSSLSDCQNEAIFEKLIHILRDCAQCQCISAEDQHQHSHHTQPANSKLSSMRMAHSPHSPQTHRQSSTTTVATISSSSSSTATITNASMAHKQQYSSFVANTATDEFFSGGSCMGVPAMCGISDVFENLLVASNGKLCSKTFNIITEIANDRSDLSCPYGGPKIVALDLLLRFRCPTNHHIYLIEDNVEEENSVIAAIRIQQKKKREEAEKERSSQMFMPGPIINRPQQQAQQAPPHKKAVFHPSPHVFSYNENPQSESEAVLDINEMLKSYVRVLSHSPNWVVVLFVLKRLSQQLSNKHLFCGASPYINKLRRRLVKWTSTRKFLEQLTSLPPHIKRNDLNVYAYSLLTVLISYRRIFTEPKQDQDEIVYAFYVGIMQVTSATRLCINSLAVCCHEMPLSVAKMLNEILQRMSQIISVSSVSVHILEFLSALARLPNLYANFTGDMYKPVFAIALNYLQHSHSQQQQASPISTPSASPMISGQVSGQKEASQGALKQYVLIMAYLVITVWFTAIPLRERRKHVPFIIQRLLSGISMGKSIDEQTYTCIDMLSRFTFADVSLAPQKSIVSKILMGDGDTTSAPSVKQSQRTWVYGHTLLTLRTAKSLGWVEVTIRRPSGTVSMMCYVENKIKSEDIDYRTLPALLMMQYQPDLMAHKIMKDRREEEELLLKQTLTKKPEENDDGQDSQQEEGLGITFDDDTIAKQFPIGTPTRRLSDQAVVSATVATRSEGLIMAPSDSSEQIPTTSSSPPPPPAGSNTVSPAPITRRPSVSQKGLIDLLNKDSESTIDTVNTNSPSIATESAIEEEEEVVGRKAIDAAVREVLSDPKPSNESTTANPVIQLRKTEPSIDPGFLYLQFNNYPDIARSIEVSPPLPDDEATARTLATFDRIPVVDFHKIGVLYVGKGQTHELEILANTYGSPDYVRFLNALGTIQRLHGFSGNTGGLDREMDIDGRYAYFWKDDVTEAVFHAATMMPTNLERDPQCSAKKRHIGNDYVSIVYNDSGMDYAFDTLPSQFNFINIVVSPHSISTEAVSPTHALIGAENSFFKVEMQRRPDMPDIGPLSEPKLVSAQSLPGFVRQAAIHANIFAQVFWQSASAGGKREYVSHWRERLKQIQRVKERLAGKSAVAAAASASATPNLDHTMSSSGKTSKDGYPYEALLDFTKYT
ncbi:Tuberous sclerosis 2-like protein [Mucor circinelloides]